MIRTANSRLVSTGVLVLSIVTLLVYFASRSLSRAQTNQGPGAASKPKVENFNFLIAAPYWCTEKGFVSTIEMKNYHVEEPLTITVILYPLDGPEIILNPMTLNPSETRLLNINEVLASYNKHFTVGAAEIRYNQLTEGVFGANLTVLNAPKSLIYNFQFRLPEMTSRLEGLWWFYDNHTDGFIAVQNTSDKNVTVVPTLYVHERRHELELLQLGPHKTRLIELRRELNKFQEDDVTGGIKLESSELGAVIAGGGLVNPDIGFSAPLRMDDPDMQAMRAKRLGQTLHALGVTIGADDPMMSMGLPSSARMNPIINLRNVSGQTIQVTPVFRYQAGNTTKTLALKPIQLNSQQLQRVDLLPYWQSGQIPSRVSSGSLEISYTGKPGSLLATVTSVDQTGSYVFDAKIDNKLAAGFHGEYWSTEGDNDTSITIKNITQKPATAWVSLQYDAGRGEYDVPPLVLQPGESHMIDLKMIQREAMPGASGELLPETVKYGGMKLREEPGGRHFLMDALVFNPKTATCGVCGYGCLYPASINIPGGTYIIALADSGEVIAVNAHMCDGTNQTGWECETQFSTDDSGVATVDPWCQAHGFGAGVGGTTFRGTAADVPGPHCGDQTLHAQRPVTVSPKITSISPNRNIINDTIVVTIQGTGFSASSTVQVAGTGITASIGTTSATSLSVNLDISSNATPGAHAVTVTTNGQPSNNDKTFFVQIPTRLIRYSSIQLPGGISALHTVSPSGSFNYLNGTAKVGFENVCGAYRNLLYQVADQSGVGITRDSISVTETFPANEYTGAAGFKPSDLTEATDTNGVVEDIVGFANPGNNCLTADPNVSMNQHFSADYSGHNYTITTIVTIMFNYNPSTHQYTVDDTISTP